MSKHLSKIFYINLDKRQDRRDEIESMLKTYNLLNLSERITAIETPGEGLLGCTMSHLNAIQLAKERNYENVLILEDDFQFIISKEEFENQLHQFFSSKIPYDVCMISYAIQQAQSTEYSFLNKVIEAQTASGYIIHHTFYDKLIDLYKWSTPLLRDTKQYLQFANDQCWKQLQPHSNWYCFTLRCGKQRPGYSDNTNQYEDYNC
jgi:GR25 family glycosyltransferase involved in LPS biosynthesis